MKETDAIDSKYISSHDFTSNKSKKEDNIKLEVDRRLNIYNFLIKLDEPNMKNNHM
ncbi:MAG: hypothetical protein M3250_01945 [Thermoproteota archaeon]|nr:hypothetical protein [Thermoproteota archaeon]